MYMDIVKEYELVEDERKRKKEEQMLEGGEEENEEEDMKYEEKDMLTIPSNPRDNKAKSTTRNLRIIEDTAKYLYNLNEDSAKYDPKSRSMNDDPNPDDPKEKQNFRGDRMAKFTGDAPKLMEQEKFVWEMVKKNNAEVVSLVNSVEQHCNSNLNGNGISKGSSNE